MPLKFGISFGLVNVPIKIYNAVKEERIGFNMLSPCCHARARQKLVCEQCRAEMERVKAKKGYEVSKGNYVILDPQDVNNVKLRSTKSIEIVGFVQAGSVDPIVFKENYYIGPEKGGEKGFAILLQVLAELGVMAVGRVVMHGKEYTVTITSRKNQLILTVLYYPSEVVAPPTVPPVEVSERERELAKKLLENLGRPNMGEFKNRYTEALKELIQAKLEGREVKVVQEIGTTAESDIEKALEASLGTTKKKKLGVAVAAQGTEEMAEL